jgi:hypothetical protein
MSDSDREAYSDEDNEYITKEELIIELKYLMELVKTKNYQRSQLQDIHDSLEEFITGQPTSLDPSIVEYIVRGWWLTDNMKRLLGNNTLVREETHTNGIRREICPFCIQTIKNETDIR